MGNLPDKTIGQIAYEDDLLANPKYDDGDLRPSWLDLHVSAKIAWEKTASTNVHNELSALKTVNAELVGALKNMIDAYENNPEWPPYVKAKALLTLSQKQPGKVAVHLNETENKRIEVLEEVLNSAKSQLITLGGDTRNAVYECGSIFGDEIQAAILDAIDLVLPAKAGVR